ncbi:tryptophan synthase subunit alpha [Paenibacillus sp. FJAT-26967]|uniref:tryptophan synthase subunit alpha n=1 Tax=Paenibacillus sp. FJAT-26967 TaxID=1729690 RepID=UPI000838775B|nr:tryptophan synthase subunit alpha [Paenibacillus sp. FJAT-26967]
MNRIDLKFAELKAAGKNALIPFITAGDPTLDHTLDIILELEKSGADIVELGVPYSDPLADGPIIQESSGRALRGAVNVLDVIELARKARSAGSELPFILFTYFNPLLRIGLERVFKLMSENEISGAIIPDLPMEEDSEAKQLAEQYGIHLIPLVAPTSKNRVQQIVSRASGFIYCVSSLGVTGVRSEFHTGIDEFLASVKAATELPIAIGFGIQSREQVERFEKTCDAIVVGSAIVRRIGEQEHRLNDESTKQEALSKIGDFIRELKGTSFQPQN